MTTSQKGREKVKGTVALPRTASKDDVGSHRPSLRALLCRTAYEARLQRLQVCAQRKISCLGICHPTPKPSQETPVQEGVRVPVYSQSFCCLPRGIKKNKGGGWRKKGPRPLATSCHGLPGTRGRSLTLNFKNYRGVGKPWQTSHYFDTSSKPRTFHFLKVTGN